tara:strand:+ start:1524 stop:1850 length:327 start_codon:yes stop_codon:yes gene_type:complete
MADGRLSRHPFRQIGAAEGITDQTLMAFGMETLLMDAGDAAGLLAAMLQGMQAQGDDGGGPVRLGPPDSANTAFEARTVIVGIAMVVTMDDGIGNLVAHRDSDGPGSD